MLTEHNLLEVSLLVETIVQGEKAKILLYTVSVSKLPLKCAVVPLYSVVKQRVKCNTGKVCNCLIQFLLTTVRGYHLQHLL
jgi:hypothetical protein